jgi:Isochorismate synthase
VRSRLVDDPGRLIDLLPDGRNPLSWMRGPDGLVGWGEVARFTATGPDRFADADEWWRSFAERLEVRDEVGVSGTGPIAFASFTFADAAPGSVLVVPRVLVGRRDGQAWVTEFTHGDGPSAVRSVSPVRPSGRLRYADGVLPVPRYRAAVAEAVRRMAGGTLGKAVLAHDLLAIADSPHDPRFLLDGLARRYPSCWSFAVDGLVGATPELLVRRTGATEVHSRVLAGTIWAADGEQPGESELAGQLLGSGKDRREHEWAVDSLAAALRPLCTDLDVPATPAVIALHNVSHLASDVHGTLDPADPATLLRLAAAVTPRRRSAAHPATPRSPSSPSWRAWTAAATRVPSAGWTATATASWASHCGAPSSTGRSRACSPGAASWPTPIPTPRCGRPRRRWSPSATRWRTGPSRPVDRRRGPGDDRVRRTRPGPTGRAGGATTQRGAPATCRLPTRRRRTGERPRPAAGACGRRNESMISVCGA